MAGLTGQYLSLLIAVQQNPFATLYQISKAAGVSKPTAAKRIRELQGVPGGRRYFNVIPLLNDRSLDLQSVDVLLSTSSLKSMETLEDVAKNHPYTGYRSRYYGTTNGLFMQFRTPRGTEALLKSLIQRLIEKGIVNDARFLTGGSVKTTYTSLRIAGWNPKTLTWNFDWNRWFQSGPKGKPKVEKEPSEPGSAVKWLTKNDINVIYELMKGARRKNSEIIAALASRGVKITPQTFSRRLAMIQRECIDGYRVTFDPAAFDIYSNVMVLGKGDSSYLDALRIKIEKNPIPFESTLRIADGSLSWFIRLQPTHLSPLLTNLYSNLKEMSVSLLDYSHSLIYSMWAETFDDATRYWRVDRGFMVDDVLRASNIE